jgi:hypothetical protein
MTGTLERSPVRSSRRRFPGVLPQRLLRWRRPVWWQEIVIIAFGYWLYTLGCRAIPAQAALARRHGLAIQHLQQGLGLSWEPSFNRFVAAHQWLAQTMDYYYATMHFIVTPVVLVWLFTRRPHLYRGARTVIVTTTLVGLLAFYLYPTAPPRLLTGFGYVDTVLRFHTWGSLADPEIAKHSNQFAAMPSLHMAWAIWCALSIFSAARHVVVRILGLLYPLATLAVIIGTGNHFILDAVGGAALVALAFALQWALSGHGAYVDVRTPASAGTP